MLVALEVKSWSLLLSGTGEEELRCSSWSLLLSGTGEEELRCSMEMFIVTMLGY